MKTKPLLAIASVGLLAVGLTLWLLAARSGERSDEMLNRLHAQRAELARALREAERQRPVVQTPAGDAPTAAPKSAIAAAIGTSASPATNEQRLASTKRSRSERMASDPEAQVLWLQRVHAKAALEYAEFFQRRNLTSSQIEGFRENKRRLDELVLDVGLAVAPGDTGGKSAARLLRERARAEYEAAQRATLGRERYEALLGYERTAWVRHVVVNSFAGGAEGAGLPVTAAQGEQLLKAALAAAGHETATSGEALVEKIDWELLDAQAQQILTPAQFAYFRSVAPPSGYASRWSYQIDAAAARAQQAEAGKSPPSLKK